jgi:hypothetical protein
MSGVLNFVLYSEAGYKQWRVCISSSHDPAKEGIVLSVCNAAIRITLVDKDFHCIIRRAPAKEIERGTIVFLITVVSFILGWAGEHNVIERCGISRTSSWTWLILLIDEEVKVSNRPMLTPVPGVPFGSTFCTFTIGDDTCPTDG